MDTRLNAATRLAGTDEIRTMPEPARLGYFGTNPLWVYKYLTPGGYRFAIEDADGVRWGFDRFELEYILTDLYTRATK